MVKVIKTIMACSVKWFFHNYLDYFGFSCTTKNTRDINCCIGIATAMNCIHYIVEAVEVWNELWKFI